MRQLKPEDRKTAIAVTLSSRAITALDAMGNNRSQTVEDMIEVHSLNKSIATYKYEDAKQKAEFWEKRIKLSEKTTLEREETKQLEAEKKVIKRLLYEKKQTTSIDMKFTLEVWKTKSKGIRLNTIVYLLKSKEYERWSE